MANSIKIKLISPAKLVTEGTSSSVRLPAKLGTVEILPDHASLITELGNGEVSWDESGSRSRFFVTGGYAEVSDNCVSILADFVGTDKDFDASDIDKRVSALNSELNDAGLPEDVESALAKIRIEEAKLSFLKQV